MIDVYWLEQTEADVPSEDDWLAESERARLGAMRFPKRRASWRLGRWTAKRALAVSLNQPGRPQALREIEIRSASSGAPQVLFASQSVPIAVSLGHRSGIALCAVASRAASLGCDLEIIEPRSEDFLADYFTAEERALIAGFPASDRSRLAALVWSAKESALKALGVGLRLDTRNVVVNPFAGPEGSGEGARHAIRDPAQALSPADDVNRWRPLCVFHTGGQAFHGWWQTTTRIVRTVVATPTPAPPIPLQLPTYEASADSIPGSGGFPGK